MALFLVKSGANIAAKGMEDDTPLHDAAYNGHLKIARMLVERGADPAARNGKGKTPVDVAAAAVYNYLVSEYLRISKKKNRIVMCMRWIMDCEGSETQFLSILIRSDDIQYDRYSTSLHLLINNKCMKKKDY